MKKPKPIFIEGEITPDFIANSIAKHQSKTEIGGHNVFMGQVRADEINDSKVVAIEFSAYAEMAEKATFEIREAAFDKYDLTCMHIYHSTGRVEVGGICFFVFVSAPHRAELYEATEYIVNRIKSEVPIFGKEILENGQVVSKKNKI